MVTDAGEEILDHDAWSDLIGQEYTRKWKGNDLHLRAVAADELAKTDGFGIDIVPSEIINAISKMKRPRLLDHYGCSVFGAEAVFIAVPTKVANLFSRVAASSQAMSSLAVCGRVAAKDNGATHADRTRAILPLPTSLAIIDAIVARRMQNATDAIAQSIPPCFLECAREKRQVLDVSFPAGLILEKGMDLHSNACIAQADVRQYYDNLRPTKLRQWMVSNGYSPQLAATFLRIHMCPQIFLKVGAAQALIQHRCIGTLTGSRSASAAGRLPLLDAARARHQNWSSMCFAAGEHKFALATYVDNLLATGSDPESATAILDDCEEYLSRHWHLQYGASSREFITCRGYNQEIAVDERWPRKFSMKCLGHHFDDDAGMQTCFRSCTASMWRCFFGNLVGGLLGASQGARMRFLTSSVAAIPAFRWSRWPFQKTYAAKLDSVQTVMTGILIDCHSRPGEDLSHFFCRRRLLSGRLAAKRGRWSKQWANSIKQWHAHVERGHDASAWSGRLLHWHASEWLHQQRVQASRGTRLNRTHAREYHGKVHRRWHEGHQEALSYLQAYG